MGLPPLPTSLKVLFSHLKVVWKHWNVHSLVLGSFIIQLFLVFFAPLRKKSSNRVLMASLWLAYLMADWIAILAIGVISDPCGSLTEAEVGPDAELYAFWGQFLLLHLGGPDTITALALEDNELWLRTGLHLAVQIYGGLGILVKSAAHSQTSMWLPTLLMFAAGVIKYAERLSSLFHARVLKFCGEPLLSNYRISEAGELFPDEKRKRSDVEMARHAFRFYDQFNCLYTGKMTEEAGWIKDYIIKRRPEEVFRMLEIEFSLTYEAFYTKTALLCRKSRWKMLRLAVTLLEVGSLVIWLFFTDKHGFKEYNILTTYTLLIGAISVDLFAFLMIHMLSEWSICPKIAEFWTYKGSFVHTMVFWCRKRTWGEYKKREDAPFRAWFRRALFRQWSESIPQLSFLSLCSEEKSNKLQKLMGLEEEIDQSKYVSRKWFSDHLRDFLHEDLKTKRKLRGGVENIGKVKGGWACHHLISNYESGMINIPLICELVDINTDYFKVVVRWHIMTELCYQGKHMNFDNDILDDNFVAISSTRNESKNNNANNTDGSDNKINHREICKILSDYLMYLLIHRQDMMSLPHYGNESLKKGYKSVKETMMKAVHDKRKSARPYLAYIAIHDYFKSVRSGVFNPVYLDYFPATEILCEFEELEKKQVDKWQFMAEVWGELLYYAAVNCQRNVHLANVKQGGELLSFVWLLLAHLGFGFFESPDERPTKALLHMPAIENCKLPVFF